MISVGETLPEATLYKLGEAGPEAVNLADLTKGRKVVIFALPGAYTGTCSSAHVPSFMRTKDAFVEKGVDEIICVSCNDPFVMAAWGDATGATAAGLTFLGDADTSFTEAMGMRFDAPPAGLHGRSLRYALFADDNVVKVLQADENPGVCDLSGGESMLEAI
ncbi:MAG: peroxiredoxin [Paracoccaceae bacterium]|jgi:peroxiredoxin